MDAEPSRVPRPILPLPQLHFLRLIAVDLVEHGEDMTWNIDASMVGKIFKLG